MASLMDLVRSLSIGKALKYDHYNQVPAIFLLLMLTELSRRTTYVKRIQAYTFWNLSAFVTNHVLGLGWEGPLWTNSVGILSCFRTANAEEICRKVLLQKSGLKPIPYFVADQLAHLAPVLVLAWKLVQQKKFVKLQIGCLSLLGQIHFAYSQVGDLDVGELYAPHDITFAWTASILGHLLSPALVNSLILKKYNTAAFITLLISIPYLIKRAGFRPTPEPKHEYCPTCGQKIAKE